MDIYLYQAKGKLREKEKRGNKMDIKDLTNVEIELVKEVFNSIKREVENGRIPEYVYEDELNGTFEDFVKLELELWEADNEENGEYETFEEYERETLETESYFNY